MSGIHGVWPFRRVEIFGSPMHGKIKNEREVDNMWWGTGKRLLSTKSWGVVP